MDIGKPIHIQKINSIKWLKKKYTSEKMKSFKDYNDFYPGFSRKFKKEDSVFSFRWFNS